MNWDTNGINAGMVAGIYGVLLAFGIGYNWLTAHAEKTGLIHGYTALFVVGGVVVTVGAMGLVSLPFALLTAGAFIASGTPMIIGSMIRHSQERRQQIEQLKAEARNGDAV
jgi:hypothetical protein